MWTHEDSVETTAAPERIWQLWSDVASWPRWNGDIEQIEIDGPFAAGSTITMKPAGQEPVALVLTEAAADRVFIDEARIDGAVIRTTHELAALGGGRLRVVYRMEISGPTADQLGPQLGPMITADFPETLTALVTLAQG
jgi:uncharacterized protein YndB with AHSA1/START domain